MDSIIKTWLVLPILLLSANCLQRCVNGKSQVPCVFIFGDSLSDSGNNNNLPTSAKSNYKPYGVDFPMGPTGRFTNGRTSVDIITQLLGFENFIPPFANISGSDILKGVNYASGGAGIRMETYSAKGYAISLGLQLRNHRVIVSQIASRLGGIDKAQQYLNKCLYYVNIGSNDYINNYFLPQFYPTSHTYSPEQYAEALIQELSLNLLALHDIGARKYVLVGLGLSSSTPSLFNYKLKSLVEHFNNKFSADSKFIFINTTLESDALSDGFLVSNAPCCPSRLNGLCIPDEKPCYNRSDYAFWDEVHPTEAWYLLIATKMHCFPTMLALIAPLNPNPMSELERIVNDLRIKYITYTVELDMLNGMVVLPSMIGHDFGDQIGRYVRLVDSNHNEFEVLVERNNGFIYLTTGWHALKDFYGVSLGAWVTMVFVGMSKFGILLKDRFGRKLTTPIMVF